MGWAKPHRPGDYVADENGCWVWQRSFFSQGYGRVRRGGRNGGVQVAHRWYYEQLVGPIPEGLQLDHLCRNRACVNPDHLEPVTGPENCRRGAKAILTMDLANQIRREQGRAADIGARYGVSERTVYAIRNGDRWAS